MTRYEYDCAPPASETVQANFVIPEGACDAHFHIFGPYDRFPLDASRKFTPPQATRENCERMHATLGMERGVIVHSGAHGKDLSATIHALNGASGKWRAIAPFHPDITNGQIRTLHEHGFRGVRANLADKLCSLDSVKKLAPLLTDAGWHIELLVDLDVIAEIGPVIARLPGTTVIDHMGYSCAPEGVEHPGFVELIRLVSRHRTWVKLSGADRVGANSASLASAKPLMQALVNANPEQLVWGSDWPHVRMTKISNDGDLLNLFGAWVESTETRNKILAINPAKLYGFEV